MKNNLLVIYSFIFSILFFGCIINNDFDVHIAYFRNDSSYDIYLQYYLQDHNNLEADYYFAYGIIIPAHTTAVHAAPLDNNYLDKIIIIDSKTRKFLKRINGATYYSMLTKPEIVIENNSNGGKTTNYNYYFILTDDFLGNN